MEQSLKVIFIERLEEKYGPRDHITSRFGTTSYGQISNDLSIGASQFSKLMSGTATEGMYQRSIDNIQRIIKRESLSVELDQVREENARLKRLQNASGRPFYSRPAGLALVVAGTLLVGFVLANLFGLTSWKEGAPIINQHPLATYFDQEFNANFNSPYLDISEVQAFCPCSAYEGTWSLSKQYKLPLPGSRNPGLYYLAKSADVRMKCARFDTRDSSRGKVLSGYEYLVNEIWLDLDMTPLSPKYFDRETKKLTPAFENLDFETQPNFRKVATIHSFFIDEFDISDDVIVRRGEPCGRLATNVDESLTTKYEIDIKYILKYVLGNLTTTHCEPMENIYCNPNDLREGESVLEFDCIYTISTENLGIGGGYPYTKGYRLEKQHYGDNVLCSCLESNQE